MVGTQGLGLPFRPLARLAQNEEPGRSGREAGGRGGLGQREMAMTSTLPKWVLYLQALLTPAIALLAVVIGYVQWRTANQRAVLDVFEKRFEIYQGARAAITEVVTKGTVQPQAHIDFLRATDKAQFLFGREVTSYFNCVYRLLVEHAEAEDLMKSGNQQTYQNAVTKKHAAFREIANFYKKSAPLVTPYMRIHQKAPSTWTVPWCASGQKK